MKPHIRLQFKKGASYPEAPDWQSVLVNQTRALPGIAPKIDTLFEKYRLPVGVTREYRPATNTWSKHELDSGLNRIYRIILQQNREIPENLIQEISRLPFIENVHSGEIGWSELPKPRHRLTNRTTDSQSRRAIHLDQAHTLFTQGDPNITVAVLDTGVDLTHLEFVHAVLPGRDFVDIVDGAGKFVGDYLGVDDDPSDEVGHGTHVAGIIAARGEATPKGVVPNCKILPVRVLGAMSRGGKRVGAGLVDNINAGIKWAIDQGADVINMSLGIRQTGGGLPHQAVVDYAKQKGVTIVAASGNDGREQLYYPGALPHAIAVGAVDEAGDITPFSTYGKQVSFVAPGTNIYSSYLQNGYAFSTGTSHAAPFVAGAVAMLKSYALQKRNHWLSDNQVKHILKHTADKVDARFKHPKAGFGKLNLLDALRLLDYKLSE